MQVPGSWRKRIITALVLLLFGPVLVMAVAQALLYMLDQLNPFIWIAVALAVVYGLGRWLFRRRY